MAEALWQMLKSYGIEGRVSIAFMIEDDCA
jgi:hypothetical protein